MNVTTLKEKGFKVVEIEKATLQRLKASGGMYEAKATMIKDNITLHMFMFSHLEYDCHSISLEETEKHLHIRNIEINNKYYDKYWHCVPSSNRMTKKENNDLWLHEDGWFGGENKVLSVLMDKRSWEKIPLYEDELKDMGFKKII